jgi:hypothetical protein
METAMAAYQQSGWLKHLCVSVFVLFACIAVMQSAGAQTRSLATLANVPVYVPAPYHSHTATTVHSSMLYDDNPYYAGVHSNAGVHYWH